MVSRYEDVGNGHRARANLYWWTDGISLDQKKLDQLVTDFQHLTTDTARLDAYETYASLYTNRRISLQAGLLSTYGGAWTIAKGKYSRVPYNLMKVVIDEATSRITKSHPYAKFMTHGGNRKAQRKAEMMERWNDGEVARLRQDEMFDSVLKDACQYGLGAIKHMKAYRESRVQTMRTYPGNLFVDPEETLFEQPRRLHHRRFVSKTQLTAMFPKFAKEIEKSDRISQGADGHSRYTEIESLQDMVELVESWHLPSFVNKDGSSPDGVRYLWCQRAVLQSTPWNRRTFPFSFFNWKRDPHNTFYGIGLGEDLLGVHIDANVTINRINKVIETIPNPHIVTKKGNKVSKAQITNQGGAVWEYAGSDPPQVIVPNTVPPDLLRYIQEHEIRAYRIAGLSSSSNGVSGSLQTGAAVENYVAAEAVPFNEQLRKFENFVKHVAENNVAVGREIWEGDKTFTVVLPGDRNTIEEINWGDVALDPKDESYVIRVAPISALSETPSARIQQVQQLQATGVITDPAEARRLMNLPDFEAMDDYASAAKRNVERMVDLAIDDNVFSPPMPSMDLQYFRIRGTEAEQKAYDMGIPEENISTLRRMVRRAEELIQRQEQAALAAAQGMIQPTQPAQSPSSGVQPTAIQETPGA